MTAVAEGVKTTESCMALAKKHQVDMPIAQVVSQILLGELKPRRGVEALMGRPAKREFWDIEDEKTDG